MCWAQKQEFNDIIRVTHKHSETNFSLNAEKFQRSEY